MKHFSQYFKKVTALFLIVCLFTVTGCSFFNKNQASPEQPSSIAENDINNNTDNSEFARYLNELFCSTLSEDTLSLHSYVQNPSAYGITDYDVTLGRYDLDNPDDTKDITEELNKLKAFNRNTLSAKQQITYDQLLKYLETRLEYSDLYLFDTCLSRTIGLQVQLPIIFAQYMFNEERDVKEYLELLNDTDGFMKNVIDYETIRSNNGYFMERSIAEEIIEQCRTFIDSAGDGYLITTFDEKLNALSGISEEAKASYKAQNKSAVNDHVIAGYKILAEGLDSLKNTGKYSGGLCNYPNGKKYFESLIQKDMGWSKTIEEYSKYLDSYITKNMLTMQLLMQTDSSLAQKCSSYKFSITEPNAMLSDLRSKITKDFPDGPSVNCNIKYITKALQDYASPAMYFTPQIDNISVNSIYINPTTKDSSKLYTTMAHEGYPGHLYQTTYFANTNPDFIRYIIEPGGYVEGWATYCEMLSYNYSDNEDAVNQMMQANNVVILCLYAKTDIGVNYLGWTLDDVYQYFSSFGFTDKSISEEIYAAMVSEPSNYCRYVLGYIGFCELRDTAKSQLGDKFDLKEFHKFALDIGPVQFDILFSRLNEWVKMQQVLQDR